MMAAPWGDARTLARLAARYAGEGPGTVVGFGLSNDERAGLTCSWGPAFRIARRAGLALLSHGRELLGPAHVRDVVGDPGAEPEPAVEITALGVDPTHQRCGHGSRLLAAAADHTRADGARVLLVWAVRGDESVHGLLASAGLERTPSRH